MLEINLSSSAVSEVKQKISLIVSHLNADTSIQSEYVCCDSRPICCDGIYNLIQWELLHVN